MEGTCCPGMRNMPTGEKAYLNEQDVTFLDPPKELIPLDPASYNPAAYPWKKVEDIPEDRRHRLLALLKPRLISRTWQVAGTRYEYPKLAKKCSSNSLSCQDKTSFQFYHCQSSGGPWPIGWMKSLKKSGEVMSTEKPYDLACEMGDGQLDLDDYPQGFPRPAKHPYPFNDQVVIYVCHIGPGVLVGQAWQEGKELQQVPRKLCGEILMVKDYGASA